MGPNLDVLADLAHTGQKSGPLPNHHINPSQHKNLGPRHRTLERASQASKNRFGRLLSRYIEQTTAYKLVLGLV